MYRRNIEPHIRDALADTPVVLINGARQTGKTTLALKLASELSLRYVTLDDATIFSAAASDPQGFIRGLGQGVVIDEVQKVPSLFPAIKLEVDSDRRPGRFLLTGSANVLLLPRMSESLAGRLEIITLMPLSQGELLGKDERFVETLFSPNLDTGLFISEFELPLPEVIVKGGFPEIHRRSSHQRRQAWFSSYITTILQRDVRDLSSIEGLTEMPRLLALLAARVGGLLNVSELSRSSGLPNSTLKRYMSLLEATFLYQPLPAWSANLGKRLIKSSRIQLVDSGLVCHLAGYDASRLAEDATFRGHLLECFVAAELQKQISWSKVNVSAYHYRTVTGQEVDVVLENSRGQLVGLEIKSAASVGKKDFQGIERFAETVGDRFYRGAVLYAGNQAVSFDERLHALPISSIWH
jgi:predicted AAA+ superfamily ATPase